MMIKTDQEAGPAHPRGTPVDWGSWWHKRQSGLLRPVLRALRSTGWACPAFDSFEAAISKKIMSPNLR
jgi:hypothetical protein